MVYLLLLMCRSARRRAMPGFSPVGVGVCSQQDADVVRVLFLFSCSKHRQKLEEYEATNIMLVHRALLFHSFTYSFAAISQPNLAATNRHALATTSSSSSLKTSWMLGSRAVPIHLSYCAALCRSFVEAISSGASVCMCHRCRTTMPDGSPLYIVIFMSKIKTEMRYLSSSVGEDRKITDLKTKVEKRDMKVRGLSRGWASLADDVLGFAGRIDKSAWDCYGLTQEADNLGYLSMMSTDAIKTIGSHTYDDESDCTEYPGYYPSVREDNNSVYYSSEFELWCMRTIVFTSQVLLVYRVTLSYPDMMPLHRRSELVG